MPIRDDSCGNCLNGLLIRDKEGGDYIICRLDDSVRVLDDYCDDYVRGD